MFKQGSGQRISVGLAAAAMLGATAGAARAEMSTAVREVAQPVAGLEKSAEIIVDYWGIPHIYAASKRDAFFLQGYNAARDRLWQIDLWRKRGLGLLAKDFGPDYVAQDRAARLFLYRGDMDREWAAYGPDGKSSAEAFVAGINAFVEEIDGGRRPLPVEFRIAGTKPDLWRAEDVVRIRSHALTRNVISEVQRARVACAAGLGADRLRRKLEPQWTTQVPAGLDPCTIPKDVLRDYELATKSVTFAKAGERRTSLDPETFFAEADAAASAVGSNNWVIAPSRTATGRPILANDPHREHSVPSLRYVVHLDAPGMSVIGAGEPALPGISIGHNEQIAFGLTIFAIDQEDLYVYETDPENPRAYRYQNGFEPMTVVRETIEVKGEAPRQVELLFTRHGPVVHAEPEQHRAFVIRSVWFEPGTSAYFGSSEYMVAKDWNAFSAAISHWGTPSENQVYADTAGNIGWIPGGRAPVRPNWDGLMPVPGDGRYEWKGFLTQNELPQSFNPPAGFVATANEMNLPPDYPVAERKIGFEWADRSRITRIKEVLGAKTRGDSRVTLADAMALQNDDFTVNGRRLTNLLAPLQSDDPAVSQGLALLKAWDHRASVDSAAAALFEVWMTKHLGKAVVAKATPAAARPLIAVPDIAAVVDLLEHPDASLGADPRAARDAVLLESLAAAVNELRQRLGPDPAGWTWGKLHHAQFVHALAPLADDATRAQLTVGRLAMGGSAFSPRAAAYRPSDFSVIHGASFRMVLDVGNWDQSVVVNTPGQSGEPYSPHYRDLAPLWAGGAYVPLLYSRAAVERAASVVFRLTPASKR
jgi:penicillin amidase